jgi:CRISPR-associated protein Cas2
MRRRYILSYDVSEPKRLRLMHRLAKGFGAPLQYSVFLCILGRADRVRLATAIADLIDCKRDRVILLDIGFDRDDSWLPNLEVFGRQAVARTRGVLLG